MTHIHIGHTFFGAGNIGDDLVLGGFLTGIGEALGGLRLTCASAFDIASQQRRFPEIEWFAYNDETRSALIDACDVWLGLGGPVLSALNDSWLLSDQLRQLELCAAAHKRVFFLGCSVDRRDAGAQSPARRLLDAASWIWPRDSLSAQALKAMAFERATPASDLSHLILADLPARAVAAGETGLVLNFEVEAQYRTESLDQLAASAADLGSAAWLVQEVRELPGSEEALLKTLSADTAARLEVRRPDYVHAALLDLVGAWGRPETLFTTRFHGAIIGAWLGSRVVAFERAPKVAAIARDLDIRSFTRLPDHASLCEAFAGSPPVARAVLERCAGLAERACTGFLLAAHGGGAIVRGLPMNEIDPTPPPPLAVEQLTLDGPRPACVGALRPGLQQGKVFVVRDLLQRAHALEPLRAMLLETVEEVAGADVRAEVQARGLTFLHEIMTIETITAMHPLVTARIRGLSPRLVAGIAEAMDLGPEVHFEDAPNLRIFAPHDFGVRHRDTLSSFAKTRGAGRLTLHSPHQDDRHFHPMGALNVWCAIDRVGAQNGMAVFPEFYGELLPFEPADASVRRDQYLGAPLATGLSPGDALCFETIHVHGSTINQTAETRVVVSFRLTLGAPEHREKQWYSYVRPTDCADDGPPPFTTDYSILPGRGPTTLDTGDRLPPTVPSRRLDDGRLEVASALVPEGAVRPVSDRFCLTRVDGRVTVFQRACPHEGADLAGAIIEGGEVVCPWHGLRLDLADGRSGCRTIPPMARAVCVERDGFIAVDLAGTVRAPAHA